MQPLLPQVSAALFSSEDAARDSIRHAMREAPHWREGRLSQLLSTGEFIAETVADPATGLRDDTHGIVLIERHDRAGWLGTLVTADYLTGTCDDPRLQAAGYTVCGSNADREWHWQEPGGKWHDRYKSEDAAVAAALKHLGGPDA